MSRSVYLLKFMDIKKIKMMIKVGFQQLYHCYIVLTLVGITVVMLDDL